MITEINQAMPEAIALDGIEKNITDVIAKETPDWWMDKKDQGADWEKDKKDAKKEEKDTPVEAEVDTDWATWHGIWIGWINQTQTQGWNPESKK